jgi:hypothetical protein
VASISDKSPSGNWHVYFRLGEKRFKRSLQTKKEAQALCGRIEDNVQLVQRGVKAIPAGGDVFLFLLSDGNVHKPVGLAEQITLGYLITPYERRVRGLLQSRECGSAQRPATPGSAAEREQLRPIGRGTRQTSPHHPRRRALRPSASSPTSARRQSKQRLAQRVAAQLTPSI